MDSVLFEKTKIAAYFLWEYTHHANSLNLWSCAEDIACYFEQFRLESVNDIREILRKGYKDEEYIQFVRQIAYRIYIYTNVTNAQYNWAAAEKLLLNGEWCNAMIYMADEFRSYKEGGADVSTIRSPQVREYYKTF